MKNTALHTLVPALIGALASFSCEEVLDTCGPCGSPKAGDSAISGDSALDGFFRAVTVLDSATRKITYDFEIHVRALAAAFKVANTSETELDALVDATIAKIRSDLDSGIEGGSAGGLSATYVPPTCAVSVYAAFVAQTQCEEKAGCKVEMECSSEEILFKCMASRDVVEALEPASPGICSGRCEGTCSTSAQADCWCPVEVECCGKCDGLCSGGCIGEIMGARCRTSRGCVTSSTCEPQASAAALAGASCTYPFLRVDYAFSQDLAGDEHADERSELVAKIEAIELHLAGVSWGMETLRILHEPESAEALVGPAQSPGESVLAPTAYLLAKIEEIRAGGIEGGYDIAASIVPCVDPALEEARRILVDLDNDDESQRYRGKMQKTLDLQQKLAQIISIQSGNP